MAVHSLCSLSSLMYEGCNYLSISNRVSVRCTAVQLFSLFFYFRKLSIYRADLVGLVTIDQLVLCVSVCMCVCVSFDSVKIKKNHDYHSWSSQLSTYDRSM